MYCKSNNIPSCRDGVHCITTSGKSCDRLLLGLPDEWAIQCAMRTEHQFEGIWYTSIQPMRFHERQCECVTVCYWNILNSFETSKKWDMLFPASLFTEVYWKGPRFHPFFHLCFAFPGLQRHGTTYRCWVVPQGSPGRFDALESVAFWHLEFFTCFMQLRILRSPAEYPGDCGDFNILLMLNQCWICRSLIHKANFHTLVIDAAPRKNGTHNDNTVQHLERELTVNDVQLFKVYEGCFSFQWGSYFIFFHWLYHLVI